MDGAAVSFERERERALARLDHTASIIRLRRALMVGLPVWMSAMLLDWLVTSVSGIGSLPTFLWLRGSAAVLIVGTTWRLWRQPEPSVRALWFYDILTFTAASVSVSVLSLGFRGIESPYGPSVVLIMLARGATMLGPWRHGAWLFAAPALAYPLTVLVAARIDPMIAAQLDQPAARANLYILLFMILVSWMMLVVGGHFGWRLRREAIETRNIGRYKLSRRLGGGGGGDVWAAIDTALRQPVALKTVSGHRPGSQALARLEREVRALSELTHPNTVRIFDYGTTDDGLYYYAMELLHGENLHELVQREGPLSSERLTRIARQILRALGEAHDKGIIHRDIKPENVFVAQMGGEAGVVKLLDFGIARTSGDSKLTRTGFVAGTPAYMAPEALTGSPADVRSDIYSFGATAYFALSGRLPFQEEEPMALLAAHMSCCVQPLSTLAPRPIPPALERCVERCMAKDPRERFASTQEVLEALNP
jgi:eukaryotic-like serine/threonine-protein kinase